MLLFLISPSPTGQAGSYALNIIIDGKTVTELEGSYCGSCNFEVSEL